MIFSFFLWNRIVASGIPGMASADTFGRQGHALDRAVLHDGVLGIAGTTGVKTAAFGSMWGDSFLVEPDKAQKERF
jgi:hypothetical protein